MHFSCIYIELEVNQHFKVVYSKYILWAQGLVNYAQFSPFSIYLFTKFDPLFVCVQFLVWLVWFSFKLHSICKIPWLKNNNLVLACAPLMSCVASCT